MYINNMYIFLVISIFILYCGIFKINIKDKNQKLLKAIMLEVSVVGILLSLASIMSLEDTWFYKIILAGGIIMMFALFSVICWKGRKVPKARAYCNCYFEIMTFTLLLIIAIFILSRFGFFG